MAQRDDADKVSKQLADLVRDAHDGLGLQLARLSEPMRWDLPALSPAKLQIQRPEERAAEEFMDGPRQHADFLARGLQENQELQMFCYHGYEKLRVLEIGMPSENVVSLRCLDANNEETHVTGHMHSVTFSFLIHTIVPPEVKRPIGFRMPSDENQPS